MHNNILQPFESIHYSERYFQLFKEGDERGLNYIYNLLINPVLRFASKIIQDEFEIKTIVQDAFLITWLHRSTIKNFMHIKAYIYNRVRWDCYSYLKGSINKTRRWMISLEHYQENGLSLAVHDPEKEIAHQEQILAEQIQLIEQAIPYLPENKKTLIELRRRGFSYKKIARDAGLSYQNIIHREKAIIKELKSITIRLEKVATASKKKPEISITDYEIYLSPLQTQILKLHYENYLSINQISIELHLTQFQIIEQHFKAMQKIKRLNRGRKRKHFK